jgi:hypothetical protein
MSLSGVPEYCGMSINFTTRPTVAGATNGTHPKILRDPAKLSFDGGHEDLFGQNPK